MKDTILISKVSSLIGTTIFNTIVNLWILEVFNSSKTLGFILSISSVSAFICSIIGGYLADSKYLLKILQIADLFSAIICVISIFFISNVHINYIYLVVFLLNINVALTAPLIKSLIPSVIKKESIISFNSTLVMFSEIIKIAIPLGATFLFQTKFLSINGALILNTVSFFISFLFIKRVPVKEIKGAIKFVGYRETIKYLKTKKVVTLLIITGGLSNFFLAGFNLLLPIFSVQELKNSIFYGIFLSAESIGALIGALSTKIFIVDKLIVRERMGLLLSSALLYLLIFWQNYMVLILLCFLLNFFYVRYNVAFQSYMQTDVDKEYIGKTFSVSYILSNILLPCGSLLFGILLDYSFGISIGLIATGLVLINLIWVIGISTKTGFGTKISERL